MSAASAVASANTAKTPRRLGRSVLAVFAGLFANALLSFIVDEVLHLFGVFPPWNQPYFGTGPYLAAVAYRAAFGVFGLYLTALLAPDRPLLHLWIGAGVGGLLSLGGVAAALTTNMGPLWYPICLVALVPVAAWLAARIWRSRGSEGR